MANVLLLNLVLYFFLFASTVNLLAMTSMLLKKVALCIGNSDYKNAPLASAKKDAKDMAGALKKLGFTVVEKHNLETTKQFTEVLNYIEKIPNIGLFLFYYSGHGSELKSNEQDDLYLLPTIVTNHDYESVAVQGCRLKYVEDKVASFAKAKVFFLDCCRLYAETETQSKGIGSANSVLDANLEGCFYAYAMGSGFSTRSGKDADTNSMFTDALLKFLRVQGRPLQLMGPILQGYFADKEKSEKCDPWYGYFC